MKAFVLTGEGIECEVESFALCQNLNVFSEVLYWPMADVLNKKGFDRVSAGDWIFLPGGFSYADHFGSGRLLAHALSRVDFFSSLIKQGAHFLGVCNGFQTLVAAKLLGEDTRLLPNRTQGRSLGFVNRWVRLRLKSRDEPLTVPVRHGEGRLEFNVSQGVEPFLFYEDAQFNNGSQDQVAGLRRTEGRSKIIGLMPHPEIAQRKIDSPMREGPDFLPQNRHRLFEFTGDGYFLAQHIFLDSF